jgi:hypothetical protein
MAYKGYLNISFFNYPASLLGQSVEFQSISYIAFGADIIKPQFFGGWKILLPYYWYFLLLMD